MPSELPLQTTDYFRNNIRRIADYYAENASQKIADRFLQSVGKGIDQISIFPFMPVRYRLPTGYGDLSVFDYRTVNLMHFSSFPYIIFYEIRTDKIIVQAIYHHSQNRNKLWDLFEKETP